MKRSNKMCKKYKKREEVAKKAAARSDLSGG